MKSEAETGATVRVSGAESDVYWHLVARNGRELGRAHRPAQSVERSAQAWRALQRCIEDQVVLPTVSRVAQGVTWQLIEPFSATIVATAPRVYPRPIDARAAADRFIAAVLHARVHRRLRS